MRNESDSGRNRGGLDWYYEGRLQRDPRGTSFLKTSHTADDQFERRVSRNSTTVSRTLLGN